MAREDRETYDQRQTRLRNEFNKQKARKAASAASEAAAAADRQRQWMEQQLHEMRMSQAQASTIDSIPGQFANPIQTVQPPAPRFEDPRMGGGTGAVNRDVMGITASDTIGNIDWNVTPWFIDKQTGAMRVLPANNNKEGFMGFGGGVGRETGMTDEEFKLAWAQQYAMGKEMPSGWSTALGRGTDAPSEAQALKILLDRGADTGVLESEAQKRSRREKAAGKVTSSVREFAPKIDPQGTKGTPPIQAALGGVRDMFGFLGGPEGGSRNQRISSGIPGSPNTYAAPIEDIDPSVRALTPEQIYDMEMDDPTRSGPITPMMALTPEQQFEQQLQAEAAATAAAPAAPAALTTAEQMELAMQGISGRSAIGDAQRARRAGEGGQTSGTTNAESLAIQTRAPRPAEVILPPEVEVEQLSTDGVWTPEMWRAAGYTMQPDGSWDIVSPPSPAPAAAAEVAPEVPRVIDTSVKDEPERRDREKVFEEYRTGDTLEVDGQYGISGDDIDNQYGGVTTPVVTSPAATAMPAATAVNMAGGQNPWGTMMQASLSPREMWQQYRMQQFGDAPLGAQLAAQRNMDIGYEPAMGRYMLGQAAGRIAPSATAFTPGERFGEYIRGGQRADLDELRRNYQMLGSALGAYGTGGTPAAGTAGYLDVFGDPSDPSRLRGNVLQATRAALGTNAFTGGGALGNIYDVMQRQYGAGGAGRFADWVGTAFQPQQQQPLFQQPANRGKTPQLLGTETLNSPEQRYDRKWEETGGEAYWSPWQMQGAM